MADRAPILEVHDAGAPDTKSGRVENAARHVASWSVVHRPSSPAKFGERIQSAMHRLTQLERLIAARSAHRGKVRPKQKHIDAALRELRFHLRTLRSALDAIAIGDPVLHRLPRVIFSAQREEPRIGGVARVYLHTVDGNFDPETLCAFLQALQAHEPLTLDELSHIAAFLQFSLLEWILREARTWLLSPGPAPPLLFSALVSSLNAIRRVEWSVLIEPLIVFDNLLRQDPSGSYGQMDAQSRQHYRDRVAFISRRSDRTETEVAQAAIDLAVEASQRPATDERLRLRRMHVGYYLLDNGLFALAHRVGFHPSQAFRARSFIRSNAEDFYIGGALVFSCLFLAAALFPVLPSFASLLALAFAAVALLPPAMQAASDLVNQCITALYDPEPLPKLDFSKGIPRDCATLVVVPTLLLSESQVRKLASDLEVRYLANRQPHLHFALLTDLPDSAAKPNEQDSHPLIELAVGLVDGLNSKYGAEQRGSFLLLHRHRTFNRRQGVWMSWERKRGKLLDLNSLLFGEQDAFPVKAGPLENLRGIRYVLTLDSDTQLPRGTAARLIGAIAHPLNRAVIDPALRIVTAGYGILQPRVGVAIRSTVHSRLAAIFSGQSGFDIYTRAVSDPYQDLFGEGIFTGKGIYELDTVHAVLNHRFPRNALLSHDLIEGAYARAGLATDVEVIDDYPSHYRAYSRRQHRWLRGDWQIAQWIFSRVPDESGKRVRNPISAISRWKIFDNLRRSLVDPALLTIFVAGWIHLPGGPLYWTFTGLALLLLPAVIQLCFGLGRALARGQWHQCADAFSAFGRSAVHALLHLILLFHQTLLVIDAVIRALVRQFVTGERLLEWETAAQAERSAQKSFIDRYLAITPACVIVLAGLIRLFAARHSAIYYALPILVCWLSSSMVIGWLDSPPYERQRILRSDKRFLLEHALRIWRYFYQFSSPRHNYLIPDNVNEHGLEEAPRVSPTNIGLLLNARQAACELGFLTAPEFALLTGHSMDVIRGLEKFRGHLYNWYDTETLHPLGPAFFASSVDSGNFLASLYTLRAGAHQLPRRPLLHRRLFCALSAYWRVMRSHKGVRSPASRLRFPGPSDTITTWIDWLPTAEAVLAASSARTGDDEYNWWLHEMLRRVIAIRVLLRDYLPWMLSEYQPLLKVLGQNVNPDSESLSVEDAIPFARNLGLRIAEISGTRAGSSSHQGLTEQFHEALLAAQENLRALAANLKAIEQNAEQLADATDFSCFVDPEGKVLSIGYDIGNQRLHTSSYDLFASEARLATFLAVARGDLPQRSWFRLKREYTCAYGHLAMLSWTGTMFEYLMPGLWIHSHPGTTIAGLENACVQVQRAFARSLDLPWGVSESGTARKNESGHYRYHAYGLSPVALSPDATAGPVISPYSTFLALGVDAPKALDNLRRMESAGWVGSFGFYEAIDYSTSLRAPEMVRQWMAHHQGMSLLAITNLLRDDAVKQWFHANPLIQANELLLNETPASKATLRQRFKGLSPVVRV